MKLNENAMHPAAHTGTAPIASLISELNRATDMIAVVDDFSYRTQANGSGSVGAQFRHNLDFVNALLTGLTMGRIDYGKRDRDIRIENDRQAAIAKIGSLKAKLEKLDEGSMNSISVRSEIESDLWFPSSMLREIEFVLSHTIHHHALIAEKLSGFGIQVEKDFGVAPSTLQYWKKQAA